MRVLLTIVLSCLVANAQTLDTLRQKYGAPISEVFEVRPDIAVLVTRGKDGDVCSMLVMSHPLLWGSVHYDDAEPMKDKVLDEILEELAPKNQRGEFLGGTHREGLLEYYERVNVLRGGQINNWKYGHIRWKRTACEYPPAAQQALGADSP